MAVDRCTILPLSAEARPFRERICRTRRSMKAAKGNVRMYVQWNVLKRVFSESIYYRCTVQ